MNFDRKMTTKILQAVLHFLNTKTASPFVEFLFGRVGPSAILFAVALIVINPIKRHTGWSVPHIGQKVIEVQPAFADSDTTATIIFPIVSFSVGAACFHAFPRMVSWRNLAYSGLSVKYRSGHSIGLFNVLFSGGRPATTGAHCA